MCYSVITVKLKCKLQLVVWWCGKVVYHWYEDTRKVICECVQLGTYIERCIAGIFSNLTVLVRNTWTLTNLPKVYWLIFKTSIKKISSCQNIWSFWALATQLLLAISFYSIGKLVRLCSILLKMGSELQWNYIIALDTIFLQVLLHIGVHLNWSTTMMVWFVWLMLMTSALQLVGVLNSIQMKNTFKSLIATPSLFCFVCKYVVGIQVKYQKEYCTNGTPHYFYFVSSAHFYSCDASYFVFLISKWISYTSFCDDCVSSIGRISLKGSRSWLWLLVPLLFIGFLKKVSSSCPLVGSLIGSCEYKNELLSSSSIVNDISMVSRIFCWNESGYSSKL